MQASLPFKRLLDVLQFRFNV